MRAAFALAILITTTWTALADSLPVIVIPGRAGVPIVINGVDASYAVVGGDWGLGKGIRMQPTVYGGHPVDPEPHVGHYYPGSSRLPGDGMQPTVYGEHPVDPEPHVGHYYPSSGRMPGYGRLEIEPPSSGKPQQAESFHQSWSAQSTPQPVQAAVPFYPPPVIIAPQNREAGAQDPVNPPQNFQYRKPRKLPQ